MVTSGPVTNNDGSAGLSRFQSFQLRKRQRAEAGEVKNDKKNLDEQKPQRRLRKVAIRRRKPQNKE